MPDGAPPSTRAIGTDYDLMWRTSWEKLTPMVELETHHYLLFDGDCGICTSFSEAARRIDRRNRFAIEPYQRYSEGELKRWGLSYAACARKLQVVSRSGRVYSGAFALNYFIYHQFPWSLLLVPIYVVPVFLLLEVAAYALLARSRYQVSRWLGLKACLVRTEPRETGMTENNSRL